MFTVKATYRNETRRFTFPESVLFPTYTELYHQLYRVFPISHNYYLSRLIFSPDAFMPGRILVGKEVHSAEDYDSCVAPLRRLWPNPLLRFTIFDETPHKASRVGSERLSLYSAPAITSSEATPKLPFPVVPSYNCILPLNPQSFIPPPPPPPQLSATCVLPPPPSPFKMSPPPPIIFSPIHSKSYSLQERGTVGTAPCCPITKGKADIETLLSSFKEDLEYILRRTFGSSHVEKQSAPSVEPSPSRVSGVDVVLPQTETSPVGANSSTSRWCFICKTSFTGVWYGCKKCPWHAVCPGCFSKSRSGHTLSFGPSHVVQQRSTDCSTQVSVQITHENKPHNSMSGLLGPTEPVSSGLACEPAPSVHRGVICDSCSSTVVGVRHKCLDCPDYDLCTACVESGATEQHNPFHEFFDIEAPGRVYVHTVSSGDRDRSLGSRQQFPSSDHATVTRHGLAPTLADPPVRHSATCNLCDSAIVGERYKCVVCPDFDTCSSCFRITTEQHPSHGFVKVSKPEDLMMRDSIPFRQVAHLAVCDSCRKTIRGARYKCLHPGCHDFDLCSDCEALPIPVHPLNHPMLKLRTSETVIPTVYQVGQTQTVDELSSQKSAPVCGESGSPALHPPSPLAAPMKSPEVTPVIVSGQATNVTAEDQIPAAEEFLSPLGSPASDVLGAVPTYVNIAPSHLLVDVADPPASPQSIHSALDIYHHLWPRVNQEMMYLNAVKVPKAGDPVVDLIEDNITEPVVHEALIVEESLPGTPTTPSIKQAGEHHGTCPVSPDPGTRSIADGYLTPSSALSNARESHRTVQQLLADDQQEILATNAPRQSCLDSSLVGDINVPDGQIFPPGAEFVKGWHMMNNGGLSWPTTTEIQFVGGEMFSPECSVTLGAKVGAVHPGRDLDIWTGDLKVPDVAGRYVGYWRLNDGQGKFFGSSVWIDLTVADHHSDQASEHSLAASSMVMPGAHPINSVNARDELQDAPQPSLLTTKTVTDEVEDPGSDISSVSLVSVPTLDDEDAEWQDTRTHSEPLEYVVLYDSNSEE